jgi:hypothetical protein
MKKITFYFPAIRFFRPTLSIFNSMRKLGTRLIIILVLLTSTTYAQTESTATPQTPLTEAEIAQQISREVETYCGDEVWKAANDSIFGVEFQNIFSTVVVGSNDVVASGSAFSYTQDKFKNTFSVNGVIKRYGSTLIDMGLSIKNEKNNFDFYSEGSWQNDIGIKLGISVPFGYKQYYDRDKCDSVQVLRKKSMYDKVKKYQLIASRSATINKRLAELELLIANPIQGQATNIYDEYLKLEEEKKILDKLTQESFEGLMTKDFAEFDNTNNIFHGYRLFWINTSFTGINSSMKIANQDIINEDIQKKYKSLLKFSIDFQGNFQYYGIRNLVMANLGLRLNRGSFLDEPSLSRSTFIVSQPSGADFYNVVDADGNFIQRYDQLKKPLMNMDFGGHVAYLFLFKKGVGLNAKFNFNFPMKSTVVADYQQNYSATAGFIVRVNKKDKWSAATFTLNGGVEREPFKTHASDNFVLKASVGVPFGVFDRTPKAKS